LVQLVRLSEPRLSPDGRWVAYQVLEGDLAANRSLISLWLAPVPQERPGASETLVARRLTAPGVSSYAPRWRGDGKQLFFLSTRSGSAQVWRLDMAGGEAQAVTHAPLDIGSFMLAPDARHLVVAMRVYPDCADLECSRARAEQQAAHGPGGRLFDRLFVRHWDRWSDGTRSQLYAYALDAQGIAAGDPVWITRGLDADVPSRPFGDDAEWCFTADGRALIFAARNAGTSEAWSTNLDLYRTVIDGLGAPENLTADNPAADTGPALAPDGRTLAWRAMKRPGFENDRFGIMLRDLGSGATRELLPRWDHSALALRWAPDGKVLYTLADDGGQRRLFAINIADARIVPLTGEGTVRGFDAGRDSVVYALDTLGAPAQLYRIDLGTGRVVQFTHHNHDRLAGIALGDYQRFEYRGWNDETVHGYLIRPPGFEPGRRYPVALLVHGGPEESLANEFDRFLNAQVFAGAGFAVLAIDFHGSLGYGQAFTDAVRGHWGDRPLEDLQKGWSFALGAFPFLDGARACAIGSSFGGFMVNWFEGNWRPGPDGPWKCLVSDDGVFDSRMMSYSSDELWFEDWEHLGPQFSQPDMYERFNPVNHVADWATPMLVIHGGRDFRVPIGQGIATFTALQRRGIPSQFLYFADENHWVLKPQDIVQWHATVQAWLHRWTAAAP
jgi:dipeptidyl aminopeptidase/acylaminoacyl peptidase